MRSSFADLRTSRIVVAVSIALAAAIVTGLPAAAFNSGWTQPKRVFPFDGQPLHASAIDSSGRVHIATEKGSQGIHYITNASGSWVTCQLSHGNDRNPSIAVEGDVAHVAFARRDDGEQGLYTASSNLAAPATLAATDCGFALVKRYEGGTGASALGVRGGTLHVAFRTSSKKLKYFRGRPDATSWTVRQTIDGLCCTSAPAIYFTTGGGVRVAYGDGTSKAGGLKFAVPSSDGWKKSKAAGGRVKKVDLALDHTPGAFTPPSNAPRVIYVVKKKGTYLSTKANAGAKGTWDVRFVGRHFGQPGVQQGSGQMTLLYGGKGKLWTTLIRVGIWFGSRLSGNGRDSKPQFPAGRVTFSRSKLGIYYSRPK